MGANNHPTTVPNQNSEEIDLVRYDGNSAHDNYMASLRSDMIRAGVIDPKLGRIIEQ